MTLDQIKSAFATQFASNEAHPLDIPQETTAAVTTISYRSGRKTWQTDECRHGAGMVAGMIRPKGRKIVTCGDSRILNGNTVFEIGSVTKVFTALLLCDMVQRGELSLSDPLAKFLPPGVKLPQRNDRQITFVDLATHTSGLPCTPTNLGPKDAANPYVHYSVAQLYEFLSSYELPREIGSQFEYSNLGFGLMGHVLSLRAGMDYGALMHARITAPLDMHDTAIALSPQMKPRLAVGHDCERQPAANWDLPALAGAGALKSTVNDLLTFLQAVLGYKTQTTSLASSMAAMLNVRRPMDTSGVEIALAWHIFRRGDGIIIGHGGHTGGYSSFVGYEPEARVGVAVLSNAWMAGVQEIGLYSLERARGV